MTTKEVLDLLSSQGREYRLRTCLVSSDTIEVHSDASEFNVRVVNLERQPSGWRVLGPQTMWGPKYDVTIHSTGELGSILDAALGSKR